MPFESIFFIRTLRLSLTCIILFFITWYYQVPESAWCLITIWFVMYEYTTIGGVFTKSLYRFTGTFLSSVYALLIIYFCQNNIVMNLLALAPGVFLYSYFFMDDERSYIAIIGCVTLTIVLFNYNRIDLALIRTFNIMLGIGGSLFMIRFFYPQYARDQLIKVQSQLVDLLSKMIKNYIDTSKPLVAMKKNYGQYEREIIHQAVVFHRLVGEAKLETKATPLYTTYHDKAFEHIGHVFRLTSVLVNYVITDKIRFDPWVIEQTQLLLSDLQSIQNKLEGNTGQSHFVERPSNPEKSLEERIKSPASKDQNTKFTKALLDNIRQELVLLDENIRQVVVIYKSYEARPNKVFQ